jgi:single-strand binding protein
MINRVVLVGRLTRDPELRYTPSGVAVTRFTLAVNRPFTNQTGEREADFINCVAWRKQAENVANFLKKGSLAGVDGRLQTRSYDAQDGKRVYVTEVVADSVQFLEPKNASRREQDYYDEPSPFDTPHQNQPSRTRREDELDPLYESGQPIDISDDDLPF